jgi:Tol biopolymer transport system component
MVSGLTRLLSANPDTLAPATQDVALAALSGDGRYAAFDEYDDLLWHSDRNRSYDVLGVDLESNVLELLSSGLPGVRSATAARPSSPAKNGLSADGRWIAFVSSANDIVPDDDNDAKDVFVRDSVTGATILVSVNRDGQSGNGPSSDPVMSFDGRFIAFQSSASNLADDDQNAKPDVFVRDLVLGITTLVSVKADGSGSATLGASSPAISADGRKIAFLSESQDLVPGVSFSNKRVFVRSMENGETIVAGAAYPAFSQWSCDPPMLAADGVSLIFRDVQTFWTMLYWTDLTTGGTTESTCR